MFFKSNYNRVWTCVFDTSVRAQGVFTPPEGLALLAGEYRVFSDQGAYEYLLYHSPVAVKMGEPVMMRFAPNVFMAPEAAFLDKHNRLVKS